MKKTSFMIFIFTLLAFLTSPISFGITKEVFTKEILQNALETLQRPAYLMMTDTAYIGKAGFVSFMVAPEMNIKRSVITYPGGPNMMWEFPYLSSMFDYELCPGYGFKFKVLDEKDAFATTSLVLRNGTLRDAKYFFNLSSGSSSVSGVDQMTKTEYKLVFSKKITADGNIHFSINNFNGNSIDQDGNMTKWESDSISVAYDWFTEMAFSPMLEFSYEPPNELMISSFGIRPPAIIFANGWMAQFEFGIVHSFYGKEKKAVDGGLFGIYLM